MELSSADEDKVIRPHRHPLSSSVARRGSRSAHVERTFSWFGRNRRLAKDFENLAETLATFVTLASIQLAIRRLARA
jgi:transposase